MAYRLPAGRSGAASQVMVKVTFQKPMSVRSTLVAQTASIDVEPPVEGRAVTCQGREVPGSPGKQAYASASFVRNRVKALATADRAAASPSGSGSGGGTKRKDAIIDSTCCRSGSVSGPRMSARTSTQLPKASGRAICQWRRTRSGATTSSL